MRFAIALVPLILLAAACSKPEVAEPEVVVDVTVAPARSEAIQAEVSAPATIYPRSEAKVASPLTAPIAKLEARKGDRVRAGQTLARLVQNDLLAQRAEAAAQVADAEANLQKVSAGTLPGDVERAQGEVEKAAAALAEAQKIYEQRQMLFKEGAIPERELLISKTQFEQAATADRVARKSLELLQSQSREQDVRMAQSRLDQAKARLDYVATQLAYADVRSPADGVITEQFLYPGDMASPAAPIFTVMNLSVAVARGQFPEGSSGALRAGQECSFEGTDAPGKKYTGKTTVVNQAVDAVRRTVEAWCEIPNPDGALKAGAFGQVAVVTAIKPDAVTAPLEAVQMTEGTHQGVVYTVGSDGVAHEQKVETGAVSGGRVEIVSGVRAGENVVVVGGYGLTDGVKVRTTKGPAGEAAQ